MRILEKKEGQWQVAGEAPVNHINLSKEGLQIGNNKGQIIDLSPDELKAIIQSLKSKPHLIAIYL